MGTVSRQGAQMPPKCPKESGDDADRAEIQSQSDVTNQNSPITEEATT